MRLIFLFVLTAVSACAQFTQNHITLIPDPALNNAGTLRFQEKTNAASPHFLTFSGPDSAAATINYKFAPSMGTAPAAGSCLTVGAISGFFYPLSFGPCSGGLPLTDSTSHLGHTVVSGITNSGGFAQILLGVNETNFGTPDTSFQGGYLQFKADSGALFSVQGNAPGGGTIFPLFEINPTSGQNFIRDTLFPYSTSGASQLGDSTNPWGQGTIWNFSSQEVFIDGSTLTLGSRPLSISGYTNPDSINTTGGIQAAGRLSAGDGVDSVGNIRVGSTFLGLNTAIDTARNGFLHDLTLTGVCTGCNTTFPITKVLTYTGHNIPTGITNGTGTTPSLTMGVNEAFFGTPDTGFKGGYMQVDATGGALFSFKGNAVGGGTIFPLFEIDPSGSNFIRGSLYPYSTSGGGQIGNATNYWSTANINFVTGQQELLDLTGLSPTEIAIAISGTTNPNSITTSGGIQASLRISGGGIDSVGNVRVGPSFLGLTTAIDTSKNAFLTLIRSDRATRTANGEIIYTVGGSPSVPGAWAVGPQPAPTPFLGQSQFAIASFNGDVFVEQEDGTAAFRTPAGSFLAGTNPSNGNWSVSGIFQGLALKSTVSTQICVAGTGIIYFDGTHWQTCEGTAGPIPLGVDCTGGTGPGSGPFNCFSNGTNAFGTTAILGTFDNNDLAFNTNANDLTHPQRMIIRAGGNITIGDTTAPPAGFKVQVSGNLYTDGSIANNRATRTTSNQLQFRVGGSTSALGGWNVGPEPSGLFPGQSQFSIAVTNNDVFVEHEDGSAAFYTPAAAFLAGVTTGGNVQASGFFQGLALNSTVSAQTCSAAQGWIYYNGTHWQVCENLVGPFTIAGLQNTQTFTGSNTFQQAVIFDRATRTTNEEMQFRVGGSNAVNGAWNVGPEAASGIYAGQSQFAFAHNTNDQFVLHENGDFQVFNQAAVLKMNFAANSGILGIPGIYQGTGLDVGSSIQTGSINEGKIYYDGTHWQVFEGLTGPTPMLGGGSAFPVLPYYSIVHYGAVCDGFSHSLSSLGLTTANFPHVTSSINRSNAAISNSDEVDWAATMEAIGVAAISITGLPSTASGGIVQLPRGICMVNKVIDIGNGTSTTNSTYNSISLQGMGMGKTRPGEEDAGTVIAFDGTVNSALPLIHVNGPVAGIFIRDMLIDALDTVGYGIWTTHEFNSGVERVTIHHPLVFGAKLDAWSAFPTGPGSNNNLWRQINVKMIDTCTAGGIQVGNDNFGASPFLDVARTDFYEIDVVGQQSVCPSGVGPIMQFGFTDSESVTNLYGVYAGPLKFRPPSGTGAAVNFPQQIHFSNTYLNAVPNAAPVVDNTNNPWVLTANSGIYFSNYVEDSGGPTFPSITGVRGFTAAGWHFGGEAFINQGTTGGIIPSFTVQNWHLGGAAGTAIEFRGTDTVTANTNPIDPPNNIFSNGRIYAAYDAAGYANSKLCIQNATGLNAWADTLCAKAGNVLIPAGRLEVWDGAHSHEGCLMTEVGGLLTELVTNEGSTDRCGQGTYSSAAQGGMIRLDTRAGQNLFTLFGRAAGTSSASGVDLIITGSDGTTTFHNSSAAFLGQFNANGNLFVSQNVAAFALNSFASSQSCPASAGPPGFGVIFFNGTHWAVCEAGVGPTNLLFGSGSAWNAVTSNGGVAAATSMFIGFTPPFDPLGNPFSTSGQLVNGNWNMLQIQKDGNGAFVDLDSYGSSSSLSVTGFKGRVARGSRTSPTPTAIGDNLTSLSGHGAINTNTSAGTLWTSSGNAAVILQATENFGPGNNGTQIVMQTTPNGSTTRRAVATFGQDASFTLSGHILFGADNTYSIGGTLNRAASVTSSVLTTANNAGILQFQTFLGILQMTNTSNVANFQVDSSGSGAGNVNLFNNTGLNMTGGSLLMNAGILRLSRASRTANQEIQYLLGGLTGVPGAWAIGPEGSGSFGGQSQFAIAHNGVDLLIEQENGDIAWYNSSATINMTMTGSSGDFGARGIVSAGAGGFRVAGSLGIGTTVNVTCGAGTGVLTFTGGILTGKTGSC